MPAGLASGTCGILARESERWQQGMEVVGRQHRKANASVVLPPG